jgi:hypothetical protein
MTLLLMICYGLLALAALALMQLTIVGIVAMHRTFVARHEAVALPVIVDGVERSTGD